MVQRTALATHGVTDIALSLLRALACASRQSTSLPQHPSLALKMPPHAERSQPFQQKSTT